MDNKEELNRLLRQSMQLKESEVPEPDESIRVALRAKVIARQQIQPRSLWLLYRLRDLMNVEIKLYQAGLALGVFVFMMVWLPSASSVQKSGEAELVADTIHPVYSSSAKQNKFLIRNYIVKVN